MKVSIYVTHYNKPEFMELQFNLLKIYCTDEYEYIIINNGKTTEYAKTISDFCKTNNIKEIQTFQDRIPNIQDHSRALKYSYDSFISKDDADFRVVMDHDMFPFNKFSVVETMEDYQVAGIRLENGPPYVSSFVIVFNKDVDLNNIPIDINFNQDANLWTYGIENKYRVKWLNHTTQGERETLYIFQHAPEILKQYTDHSITFQIIEPNLLHYWQGSGWLHSDKAFHDRKFKFIKFILDNAHLYTLQLDSNIFYERAIMDEWIRPNIYPLNKIII